MFAVSCCPWLEDRTAARDDTQVSYELVRGVELGLMSVRHMCLARKRLHTRLSERTDEARGLHRPAVRTPNAGEGGVDRKFQSRKQPDAGSWEGQEMLSNVQGHTLLIDILEDNPAIGPSQGGDPEWDLSLVSVPCPPKSSS